MHRAFEGLEKENFWKIDMHLYVLVTLDTVWRFVCSLIPMLIAALVYRDCIIVHVS